MQQQLSLSPPGRVRLVAPDLARGFMLLLIALANVTIWIDLIAGSHTPAGTGDRVWVLLRTSFIDTRAYPLFAFLFGYGLATMSRFEPWLGPVGVVIKTRTLRRRGLWLLAFGAIHALLFPGDILGSYGLVALVMASLIATRSDTGLKLVGWLTGIVGLLISAVAGLAGELSTSNFDSDMPDGLLGWAINWGLWVLASAVTPAVSMMLPAVVVGVYAADRGWLNALPHQRARLGQVAVVGLAGGALLGLPYGLNAVGWLDPQWWFSAANGLGGPLSAAGWVALLTWIASWVRTDATAIDRQAGIGLLVAVGRRSLTCYLAQSVGFGAFFFAHTQWQVLAAMTPGAAALVALVVWCLTVVFAHLLARFGRPGPADQLLRRLVQLSASQKPIVVPPAAYRPQPPLA